MHDSLDEIVRDDLSRNGLDSLPGEIGEGRGWGIVTSVMPEQGFESAMEPSSSERGTASEMEERSRVVNLRQSAASAGRGSCRN